MLIKKQLLFDKDLNKQNNEGVRILAKAVKSTLGPGGNPVLIERKGKTPLITKDGVTVAKNIVLKNSFQNLAVQTMIEVAEKTNVMAGDGTSTSIIFAEAIYNAGQQILELDPEQNTMNLSQSLKDSAKLVLEKLEKYRKDIDNNEQIKHVATISANGDEEIGKLLAEAVDGVGKDGLITIEESGTHETTLHFVEGFKIEKGMYGPEFINDERRNISELKNPNIFLYNGIIDNMHTFMPVLQQLVDLKKPFLIIAEDIKHVPLETLKINMAQGHFEGLFVKAPGFGVTRREKMKDIAILTGAKLIDPTVSMNLQDTLKEHFGQARLVTANRFETTIVEGAGKPELIQDRIEILEEQLTTTFEHKYDKEIVRERMAMLSGSAAIISLGAVTEMEMKEKKDRLEDALNATKAALDEGIIPGGGITFYKISKELDNNALGNMILKLALQIPMKQILKNAGLSFEVVSEKINENKKNNFGFNVRTNQYGDSYEMGVIDPFKVAKHGLLNAISIASLLLTTKVSIVIDESEEKKMLEDLN